MLCKFEPISLENDLALLELSSAVALQENIIPVCLHTEEDSLGTYVITKILPLQPVYIMYITVGARGWITGWGLTRPGMSLPVMSYSRWPVIMSGGSLAPVLRQLEVPIMSNRRCELLYRRAGHPQHIPDIFMCAGYSQVLHVTPAAGIMPMCLFSGRPGLLWRGLGRAAGCAAPPGGRHRLAPGRGGQLGHRVRGAGPARGHGQTGQVQTVDTAACHVTLRPRRPENRNGEPAQFVQTIFTINKSHSCQQSHLVYTNITITSTRIIIQSSKESDSEGNIILSIPRALLKRFLIMTTCQQQTRN